MPSLLHRLGVVGLLLGSAALTASACGGAAASDLDDPPSDPAKDSGVKTAKPDATGGSSSGGDHDATARDDVDVDPVDATLDTGTGSTDDASDMASDAGTDGGSICGPCSVGNRCCTSKGAVSYGQCYNSFVCALCCP
jgi:hypothetical protein